MHQPPSCGGRASKAQMRCVFPIAITRVRGCINPRVIGEIAINAGDPLQKVVEPDT